MNSLNHYLNEKAVSKSQRRLFGMAVAYKRGELDTTDMDKDLIDKLKELSKLPIKTLDDFAKTKDSQID